jgi:hypothetical protein
MPISLRLGHVAYEVWRNSPVNRDSADGQPITWDELRKLHPVEAEMWALIADAVLRNSHG